MKGEVTEKKIPTAAQKEKRRPKAQQEDKEMPVVGAAENKVEIDGVVREIKPTKLRYQRNHTAAFYQLVDNYPLPVILTMDADSFPDGRDGDKCLLDWLVAVFDDEEFVTEHYNNMDTEFIEKVLQIYRRVNHIDEKEEKLKKLNTPQKGA